MKIAIDVSPLENIELLSHRVRGTGFYIENLKKTLLKYFPENNYTFFTRGEKLSKNIDVVHYPYFEPFFLSLPAFKSCKTVVTVHDLTPLVFPSHFKPGLKGWFKWQIQKLALRNADAIITDSESSKKDIIKYVGISYSKIHVVYLAAGEEFAKIQDPRSKIQDLRSKYKLPKKFVLYVGDATWNKNLPRLIEAASKINVPLVMAGKALIDKNIDMQNPWNKDLVKVQGMIENQQSIPQDPQSNSQDLRPKIQDLRSIPQGLRSKTQDLITRLGFVSSEDLIALYNLATLFIMPSIYEGFGLPILEAMSCGCPVVASRGGSLVEVVGEAGKYIDPYDVDSIVEGIGEVFNDSSLQKELSQKGLIQAKKFTWKKTADKTMDVYRSVAVNI